MGANDSRRPEQGGVNGTLLTVADRDRSSGMGRVGSFRPAMGGIIRGDDRKWLAQQKAGRKTGPPKAFQIAINNQE
jgi:hypothetical protein